MDGQCNAYKYDADTETCSAAKVTNFLILKDFWKMLFNDLSWVKLDLQFDFLSIMAHKKVKI